MAQLEITNMSKAFGAKEILRDINFKLDDGKMLGLVGPSGCGKSTTLKIIAGLTEQDGGNVYIDGNDMTKVPMEKRHTVIVFQDFLLFPHMTVAENIGFGLKVNKVDKKTIKEKVNKLIGLVHLEGNEKKYPHQLSGGQKQRVAIARALAVQPKVLLLDEPFSSLDARLREEMRSFIKEIHEKTDTTIILVTHDKEEAFELCDLVGIMMQGKLMQVGQPREVYENPNSKAVAEFFGPVHYLKGNVTKGLVTTQLGTWQVSGMKDGEYEWLIRPEDITLEEEGIKAKIIETKFLGAYVLHTIEVEGVSFLMQTPPRIHLEVGQEVKVDFHLRNAM